MPAEGLKPGLRSPARAPSVAAPSRAQGDLLPRVGHCYVPSQGTEVRTHHGARAGNLTLGTPLSGQLGSQMVGAGWMTGWGSL